MRDINERIFAVLRGIATYDPTVRGDEECGLCGGTVRFYGDDAVGVECWDTKHKPDCPVILARALAQELEEPDANP